MNAEKIYTITKEAMTAYAEQNAEDFPKTYDESIIAYWERYGIHKPFTALYRLNKDAMEEMYTKSARNSSKPSLSAIKRILKGAINDALKKAWWQDGLWAVCDGYRMVGLKEAVPSIPTYDENVDKYQTMNAKGVWFPLFDGTPLEEVEIPQKGEIKQAILDAKAKGDKKAYIKVGVRFFDAQYLLDMVDILPNAKMYQADGNQFHPNYFRDEEGNIGVLLPIRRYDN